MSHVPAADKTMEILLCLAREARPLPAAVISRETGIARSSLYHLLAAMAAKGFVTSMEEERLWGIGASAFEIGSAYMRQEQLERRARSVLVNEMKKIKPVTAAVGHVGILHGSDTLYLLKESVGPTLTLVTDVGVRLPASLTASGRAMLAHLSPAQVRALFPTAESFISRTGKGPRSLRSLRDLLNTERRQGFASEESFVTEGYASVASPVFDHLGYPTAAFGLTFRQERVDSNSRQRLIASVQDSALALTHRIGGRNP